MKEKYLQNFCQLFEYPKEAEQALTEDYRKLSASPAISLFDDLIEQYQTDRLTDFNSIWEPLDRVAAGSGVHIYTIHFLFFIACSEHLKERYQKEGIDLQIWKDSMADLKWKLMECHKLYQIWGTFVGFWYPGFFLMYLFGIGRLEFEVIYLPQDYRNGNFSLNKGAPVINIHIPSCGKLLMDDCMASFRKAYTFFKQRRPECFGDQEILPFFCSSWLLYKEHEKFLPENSNIRRFMKFFDIFTSYEDKSYHDFWRIFYKPHDAKREELPRETSLQRAYLDWEDQGNYPGIGTGIFFFDGQNIKK